jgi:predicted RNA-binding protein YlxR (DUF448 family)
MQRPNEGPQRTCLGCRERDRKEHMLRIAVHQDTLKLDEEDRLPGRGAYLHYRNRCITSFGHGKARDVRSLKRMIGRDERRRLMELIHTRLASSAALE